MIERCMNRDNEPREIHAEGIMDLVDTTVFTGYGIQTLITPNPEHVTVELDEGTIEIAKNETVGMISFFPLSFFH